MYSYHFACSAWVKLNDMLRPYCWQLVLRLLTTYICNLNIHILFCLRTSKKRYKCILKSQIRSKCLLERVYIGVSLRLLLQARQAFTLWVTILMFVLAQYLQYCIAPPIILLNTFYDTTAAAFVSMCGTDFHESCAYHQSRKACLSGCRPTMLRLSFKCDNVAFIYLWRIGCIFMYKSFPTTTNAVHEILWA